ncbi:uncharacterized protein LOC130444690 [Diorhabda sublineata]|uniref:uncharacterized protein LOC130444690 n=1 Tax=Diorhabda sublineata TaxID=1163346 RepID=UPI0024E09BFA|nr:uncharacterized protein LOC130444690 [Diorhabda sublineata]
MFFRPIAFLIPSLLIVGVQSSGMRLLEKVFHQCASTQEMFKCLKIQAIKIVYRAVMMKKLDLFDGVSFVANKNIVDGFFGRNFTKAKLARLESLQLNDILSDIAIRFMESHRLELKNTKPIEESRKKKNKGGSGNLALYWALATKAIFLAIAYKGIAVMSGFALVMGKMALLLAAVIGLKILVSGGQKQTTLEIVEQPQYSKSHSHSTSYENGGYSHHRLYDIAGNGSRTIPIPYI